MRSLARGFAAVLMAVSTIGGTMAALPARAEPTYTMEEKATAIAAPALIYVELQFTGVLRRRDTGAALHESPIVINNRCSGFVVSGQGHAVTDPFCLKRGRESAINSAGSALATEMIRDGRLAADQREVFMRDLFATADFGGVNPGSTPTVKVFGQLFQGKQGLSTEPAIPGEIVSGDKEGDEIALIKFVQAGLPMAEIGDGSLDTNDVLVQAGFESQGSPGSIVYVSRTRTAKVSGKFGAEDSSTYLMDGDAGPYTLGGMAIDPTGKVAGMIKFDPNTGERITRLVISAEQITKVMAAAGASNELTETDLAYRQGLDSYFGGRYSEASTKLGQVLSLMPDHATAAVYRQKAIDGLGIEGGPSAGNTPSRESGGWLITVAVILGVGVSISLIIIALLVARNRAQARQLRQAQESFDPFAAPISAIPVSAHPVSVYPMTSAEETYGTADPWAVPSPPALPSRPHTGHDLEGGPEQSRY